jgi:hypothetical protein
MPYHITPNIGHKLILLSPLSCRRLSWHGNAFSRYLCLTLLSLIIRELKLASVNLSLSAFYLASLITQDLSLRPVNYLLTNSCPYHVY